MFGDFWSQMQGMQGGARPMARPTVGGMGGGSFNMMAGKSPGIGMGGAASLGQQSQGAGPPRPAQAQGGNMMSKLGPAMGAASMMMSDERAKDAETKLASLQKRYAALAGGGAVSPEERQLLDRYTEGGGPTYATKIDYPTPVQPQMEPPNDALAEFRRPGMRRM